MLVVLHIRRVWQNQGSAGRHYCVVLTPKWIENASPRGRFVSQDMKVSQIAQKTRSQPRAEYYDIDEYREIKSYKYKGDL